MSLFLYSALGTSVILLGGLLWRLSSNRHKLPCPSWLSWLVELDNPFAHAHKASSIIESLPIFEGIKILDIGCGPGRVALPLAQKVAEKNGWVTGLDIQHKMIEKTQNKAHLLGLTNIDFIHGALDTINLNRNTYDVVLMVCILGEIPKNERVAALTSLAGALKPNGIVSITETIFDPHFQKTQTVVDLMKKAGFAQKKFIGNKCAYTLHFEKKKA